MQLMRDLASPVAAFVRQQCWTDDRQASVGVEALYGDYKGWCEDEGLPRSSKDVFGRDLRAVCPWVRKARVRLSPPNPSSPKQSSLLGEPDKPREPDKPPPRSHVYRGIRLREPSDKDQQEEGGA